MREQMFSKSDANGDGGLDIDEFKAMGKNLPAGKSDQANGDKTAEVFAKIDTDGDGKITQSEMEAAKPEPKGPPPGMLLQIQEDAGSSSSSSLADQLATNSKDVSSRTTALCANDRETGSLEEFNVEGADGDVSWSCLRGLDEPRLRCRRQQSRTRQPWCRLWLPRTRKPERGRGGARFRLRRSCAS